MSYISISKRHYSFPSISKRAQETERLTQEQLGIRPSSPYVSKALPEAQRKITWEEFYKAAVDGYNKMDANTKVAAEEILKLNNLNFDGLQKNIYNTFVYNKSAEQIKNSMPYVQRYVQNLAEQTAKKINNSMNAFKGASFNAGIEKKGIFVLKGIYDILRDSFSKIFPKEIAPRIVDELIKGPVAESYGKTLVYRTKVLPDLMTEFVKKYGNEPIKKLSTNTNFFNSKIPISMNELVSLGFSSSEAKALMKIKEAMMQLDSISTHADVSLQSRNYKGFLEKLQEAESNLYKELGENGARIYEALKENKKSSEVLFKLFGADIKKSGLIPFVSKVLLSVVTLGLLLRGAEYLIPLTWGSLGSRTWEGIAGTPEEKVKDVVQEVYAELAEEQGKKDELRQQMGSRYKAEKEDYRSYFSILQNTDDLKEAAKIAIKLKTKYRGRLTALKNMYNALKNNMQLDSEEKKELIRQLR